LGNGLSLYVEGNSKPSSTIEFRLVVKVGSLVEVKQDIITIITEPSDMILTWNESLASAFSSCEQEEHERGLAHFLEHMAFKGTKSFDTGELIKSMEKIGVHYGQHLNASTGQEQTVYKLTVPVGGSSSHHEEEEGAPTESSEKKDSKKKEQEGKQQRRAAKRERVVLALTVLQEFASSMRISDADVETERRVIEEERRSKSGASKRLLETYWPKVFGSNSKHATRFPIGLSEVVTTCKAETLRLFYKKWYRPDLMAVVVVGDFTGLGDEDSDGDRDEDNDGDGDEGDEEEDDGGKNGTKDSCAAAADAMRRMKAGSDWVSATARSLFDGGDDLAPLAVSSSTTTSSTTTSSTPTTASSSSSSSSSTSLGEAPCLAGSRVASGLGGATRVASNEGEVQQQLASSLLKLGVDSNGGLLPLCPLPRHQKDQAILCYMEDAGPTMFTSEEEFTTMFPCTKHSTHHLSSLLPLSALFLSLIYFKKRSTKTLVLIPIIFNYQS
jgi:hypothetical protein